MTKIEEVKKVADKAVVAEKSLIKLEQEFALSSPKFAKFLKDQKETQRKIEDMWLKVKQELIDADYTDILENDNFKISISKVLNLKIEDIEEVPEEFTETVKTAKLDKIKKYVELYEELPKGIKDASFYKLNKKIKE